MSLNLIISVINFSEGTGSNGDEDDDSSEGGDGEDKPDGEKNNEEGSEDIGEQKNYIIFRARF